MRRGEERRGDKENKSIESVIRWSLSDLDASFPQSDTYTDNRGGFATGHEKAEKLLTFAEPILHEFASQIGKAIRRIKNTTYYGQVDCLVRYEFFIPNSLGMPKKRSPTLTISIGEESSYRNNSTTHPLTINSGKLYGKHVDIKMIDEEWFIGVLVKEYREMINTPSYYGWR